jgi:hypothetical protein
VNLAGVTKVGLVLPPNSNDNDGGVGVGATPIPQQFDSRTNWAFCGQHFIDIIRDQSACSSCWAVAAGAMLTDRLCIRQRTLGEIPYASPFLVSETDILSCSGAGE